MSTFCGIRVLPNVLTEISKILGYHDEPERTSLFQHLREVIFNSTELLVESVVASAAGEFPGLGLCDSAMLTIASPDRQVLTMDRALHGLCNKKMPNSSVCFHDLRFPMQRPRCRGWRFPDEPEAIGFVLGKLDGVNGSGLSTGRASRPGRVDRVLVPRFVAGEADAHPPPRGSRPAAAQNSPDSSGPGRTGVATGTRFGSTTMLANQSYSRRRRSGLVLIMVWMSSAGTPRSSMQAMNWRSPSNGVDSA